jgi:hypothetical protein
MCSIDMFSMNQCDQHLIDAVAIHIHDIIFFGNGWRGDLRRVAQNGYPIPDY